MNFKLKIFKENLEVFNICVRKFSAYSSLIEKVFNS